MSGAIIEQDAGKIQTTLYTMIGCLDSFILKKLTERGNFRKQREIVIDYLPQEAYNICERKEGHDMKKCSIKAPFFEIGPKSYLYGDDIL